jgi:Flp pilus assembly protein TadB
VLVSKERARRRAERELVAVRESERRAAQAERRRRREQRRSAARALLPGAARRGRQNGILARRARLRTGFLVALLAFVNVVVWIVRPDWEARLGVLVIGILAFPVLRTLLFPRP